MKAFDDLTEAELLAIDGEGLEHYIDLACAEAGVALLPELPPRPSKDGAQPDLTAYVVGGFEFSDKADADRVLGAIHSAHSYGDTRTVGGSYSAPYRWVPLDANDVSMSERRCFSPTIFDSTAADIARRADEKTAYDRARMEYDQIENKRNEIRRELTKQVQAVQAREQRRARLRRDHARYLDLAGGLRRVAARFLRDAHEDAEELLPEAFVFAATDPADPKPRAYHGDETATAPREEIPF